MGFKRGQKILLQSNQCVEKIDYYYVLKRETKNTGVVKSKIKK